MKTLEEQVDDLFKNYFFSAVVYVVMYKVFKLVDPKHYFSIFHEVTLAMERVQKGMRLDGTAE